MSNVNESVLVVEDDAALREALVDTLRAAGLSALSASDAPDALQRLQSEEIALVISDVQMPGPDGYQLLSSIKRLQPDLPVVLMTAYGTVAQAVAAMREGATDYIVKPFDAQALIEMARRQLALRVVPNELVAVAPESKRLVSLARKIAENDATVLITGESGTGKEVYARFIRDHSARSAPMPANSSRRRAAPCCWTRFPKWTWDCKPKSCAFCRSAKWSAWAAAVPSASTFV